MFQPFHLLLQNHHKFNRSAHESQWVFALRNQITDQTYIRWGFFTVSKIIKTCLFFSNVHQWVYSLDLDDKTAGTDAKNSGCKWQDSTELYFLVSLFTML